MSILLKLASDAFDVLWSDEIDEAEDRRITSVGNVGPAVSGALVGGTIGNLFANSIKNKIQKHIPRQKYVVEQLGLTPYKATNKWKSLPNNTRFRGMVGGAALGAAAIGGLASVANDDVRYDAGSISNVPGAIVGLGAGSLGAHVGAEIGMYGGARAAYSASRFVPRKYQGAANIAGMAVGGLGGAFVGYAGGLVGGFGAGKAVGHTVGLPLAHGKDLAMKAYHKIRD